VPPRYSEQDARVAVAASKSYAEALRRMGASSTGNSFKVLQKYVRVWAISVEHFDPHATMRARSRVGRVPLDEVLRTGRPFSRGALKRRLYDEGYKDRRCEDCGQGELWRGRQMALILDHVNGVPDDNRLQNLRILCPNCAATLDTHCGRNARAAPRPCEFCGTAMSSPAARRFCSRQCAGAARRGRDYAARPASRKVERPPVEVLIEQVAQLGWSATGRLHGVSDNAVRKWMRAYERDGSAHRAAGRPAPQDGSAHPVDPPAP
jgi:hypothetical protein